MDRKRRSRSSKGWTWMAIDCTTPFALICCVAWGVERKHHSHTVPRLRLPRTKRSVAFSRLAAAECRHPERRGRVCRRARAATISYSCVQTVSDRFARHRLWHPPPRSAVAGHRARRRACGTHRFEFHARTPPAPGETDAGQDPGLLRRQLHHAPVGSDGLSSAARELEGELPRVERRGFRLGWRQDPEHAVAAGAW